jgi:hypothetical protein
LRRKPDGPGTPDTRIMMQRFILENQGFIPRKLSNPAPNIKDLARFCQTG